MEGALRSVVILKPILSVFVKNPYVLLGKKNFSVPFPGAVTIMGWNDNIIL
jgi:hypothetical protein